MRPALALTAPLALVAAAPSFAAREGDILKVFEKRRVAVVAAPELQPFVEATLLGCPIKERVVERERAETILRLALTPEHSETVLSVLKVRRNVWEVTLTAPDQGNLSQLIREFRRLKEPPKQALRQIVRSVAVIPIGPGATTAATTLLTGTRFLATPDAPGGRRDEIVLWDRSVPGGLVALPQGAVCGPLDTLAWRESLPGGGTRAVIAAPSAGLLTEALRRLGDPLAVGTTPTIVATAHDLRAVKRVAVSGIGENKELAKQLASRAATALRSLGAFEVLEREGLSALLSEVALSQAGITEAPERTKLAQLASADTLLIVALNEVSGQTEYVPQHERLTPKLGAPPPRPLEPSRYRLDTGNDPIARAAAEALLGPKVGLRSEREFAEAMDDYRFRILPAWERALYNYQQEKRTRRVSWQERVSAKGSVVLQGSVRLVSLTDGTVLWEAPLSASESGTAAHLTRTIATIGEDSVPRSLDLPAGAPKPPTGLALRAGESALTRALTELPATALLPTGAAKVQEPLTRGTVLDVEGGTVQIGMGASDGVKPGDVLLVRFPDSSVLRLIVTRVRPRTCEAAFEPETGATVRARVTAGLPVELAR